MNSSKTNSAFIALFCLIFGFIIFAIASVSEAADVTLSWTKPDDSRVTGYYIYYGIGSEKADFTIIPVSGADITSQAISGLVEGQSYNFTATSRDIDDNRSDFATPISYTIAISEQSQWNRAFENTINLDLEKAEPLSSVIFTNFTQIINYVIGE